MKPRPDSCIRQDPNLKPEGQPGAIDATRATPRSRPAHEGLRARAEALATSLLVAATAALPFVSFLWRAGGQAFFRACLRARCWGCAAPLENPDDALCPRCDASRILVPPSFLQFVPFAYDGAVAKAIRRAKFRADASCARALSLRFALEAAATLRREGVEVDAVTFVPSHWRRRLRRRVELPALCAAALASQLGVPLLPLLVAQRCDPPLSQGADPRERRARVAGRFRFAPPARLHRKTHVPPRRVLLLDDVFTTGATLLECQRILEQAGCSEVWCLALASTPARTAPAPQPDAEQRTHAVG